MFQIEFKDLSEVEAIISGNITSAHKQRLFLRMEDFRAPISVRQCYNCQNFGHSATIVRQKLNVSSLEKATCTKDAQIGKKATKVCLL